MHNSLLVSQMHKSRLMSTHYDERFLEMLTQVLWMHVIEWSHINVTRVFKYMLTYASENRLYGLKPSLFWQEKEVNIHIILP